MVEEPNFSSKNGNKSEILFHKAYTLVQYYWSIDRSAIVFRKRLLRYPTNLADKESRKVSLVDG